MTTIDKIRAEIMRMHQEAVGLAIGNQTDWLKSRVATCVDLLSFLDTLEEKCVPEIKETGTLDSEKVKSLRPQK